MATVEELLKSNDTDSLEEKLEWELEEVIDKITDVGRWAIYHYKVVLEKETGKYYSYSRGYGATECQEDDDLDIDCIQEVKPITKLVEITTYEAV